MLKELENFGGYAGHATIQILHGKKIVDTIESHNAGKASLFKYIADCLSGATSSNLEPGRKPGRLILTSSGTVTGTISVPYSDVKRTITEELDATDSSYAYYSLRFTVPMTMLNEGMRFNALKLYSLDGKELYAEIDISESSFVIDTANTSLVVEWQLAFMNK